MDSELTNKVKNFYGGIATRVSDKHRASCCPDAGCSCTGPELYQESDRQGLPEKAVNASLGCANPLVAASLTEGECVLDLGSGGGIDVLLAAKQVGPTGWVYGLDMTDEMLSLAQENQARSGVANVQFIKGQIEEIPLPDSAVDVVISNCVLNLSPDKPRALAEAYRVLRPGGRICVADTVALKPVPTGVRQNQDLWCSCLAGSLEIGEYENYLREAGFTAVSIQPVYTYPAPTDIFASAIVRGVKL